MIYFKKLIKLPGPKDIGMSDSNYAMSSEFFRNNSTEKTWEDFYARIKKDYPIRYFFASTAPSFFRHFWMKLTAKPFNFIYWLKCMILPSHKFHLIDIREKNTETNIIPYRFGWIDSDVKMTFAMFKILCDFVEKEMPVGYFIPNEEDASKDNGDCNSKYPGYKSQREQYLKIMEIYNYWNTDRFILNNEYNAALSAWDNSREKSKGDKNSETEELYQKMEILSAKKDKKLEEMLHRLIDIRHSLWT